MHHIHMTCLQTNCHNIFLYVQNYFGMLLNFFWERRQNSSYTEIKKLEILTQFYLWLYGTKQHPKF